MFDKNRDGYIDENELRETMQELGVTLSASDISAMMKRAGCKISGRIYYEGTDILIVHIVSSSHIRCIYNKVVAPYR